MRRSLAAGGITLLLLLAGCGAERAGSVEPGRSLPNPPPPSTFVAVVGRDPHGHLALVSASTGKVLRNLVHAGMDFTNNGLDRSLDGRWIYTTWIGRHALRIERISSKDGSRRFIANGVNPVLSPDGGYLAYAQDKTNSVAVRDLHTGRTRTWNLHRIIGNGVALMNGNLFWLASGELVAYPGTLPIADTSRSTAPKSGPCSGPRACLVHFDPARAHPDIHRLIVPRGEGYDDFAAGGTSHPHSVLVYRLLDEKTALDLIDIRTGRRAPLATVPGMALTLDRTGTHVLYLLHHSPPVLWRADLRDGRLTHTKRIPVAGGIGGGIVW